VSDFSHAPKEPASEHCKLAYHVFQTAFAACGSFLNSFDQVRRDRNAHGAPTDLEQDLLRAMLVFACSGLDALIKQLIKDALPVVIEKNEGAEAQFRAYIEKRIGQEQKFGYELIALSLTSRAPREQTLERFKDLLSQDSLQSKDQIFQVASFFDIPSPDIFSRPNDLRDVFKIRNKIIHELDIDRGRPNRSRVSRRRADMIRAVNIIFQTTSAFLSEVDKRCK
jgi:hypothetical protein